MVCGLPAICKGLFRYFYYVGILALGRTLWSPPSPWVCLVKTIVFTSFQIMGLFHFMLVLMVFLQVLKTSED